MLSAPTSTAPAVSSRAISVASHAAGAQSRLILEPASVGSPATSNRFLTANGTPASGPSARPSSRALSIARAFARARSSSTAVKALSTGLSAAMRASAARTTALALVRPARTAAAISLACAQVLSIRGQSQTYVGCASSATSSPPPLAGEGQGGGMQHERTFQLAPLPTPFPTPPPQAGEGADLVA